MKRSYKNGITLILLLCLFFSCNEKNKEISGNASSPTGSYQKDFENVNKNTELTNKIINGDTIAYEELKEIYFNSDHVKDFLKHSLIMANNFNHPKACLDVYHLLKTNEINNENNMTNKLANYYLLKAHEMGAHNTEKAVKERFGQLTELPKSKDYWAVINK